MASNNNLPERMTKEEFEFIHKKTFNQMMENAIKLAFQLLSVEDLQPENKNFEKKNE